MITLPRTYHWCVKKQVRPFRKVGHITVTDPDADIDDAGGRDALLDRAKSLRDAVTFVGE